MWVGDCAQVRVYVHVRVYAQVCACVCASLCRCVVSYPGSTTQPSMQPARPARAPHVPVMPKCASPPLPAGACVQAPSMHALCALGSGIGISSMRACVRACVRACLSSCIGISSSVSVQEVHSDPDVLCLPTPQLRLCRHVVCHKLACCVLAPIRNIRRQLQRRMRLFFL